MSELTRLTLLHQKMVVLIADGFVDKDKASLLNPFFDLFDLGIVMVPLYVR